MTNGREYITKTQEEAREDSFSRFQSQRKSRSFIQQQNEQEDAPGQLSKIETLCLNILLQIIAPMGFRNVSRFLSLPVEMPVKRFDLR